MKKLILILFAASVAAFAQLTAVSLVSPASGGSATVQTFDFRVAGGAGGYGTDWTQLIISTQYNSTYGIPNSCSILFYPNGNVYIGNDAQTVWQSGAYFGNSGSISNSQCSVNLATAYMTTFGSSRDWIFTITFSPSFTGQKYLSGGTSVSGGSVYTTPPAQFGIWTVPGAGGPPTVSLASPAIGGSASVQRFSIVATGADQGWTDLTITPGGQQAAPWTGWAVPNSCDLLFYPNGTMYIGNNAQTDWTQPVAMGSIGMISNSQCSADVGSATNSLSGNSRTYSVTITFTPAFAGPKTVMGMSSTSGGVYNTPITFGTWTVSMPPANGSMITLESSGPTLLVPYVRFSLPDGSDPYVWDVATKGQSFVMTVRDAAPNSQVWARQMFAGIGRELNGDRDDIFFKPTLGPWGNNYYSFDAIDNPDSVLNNIGWLVGVTDANGYFSGTFTAGPFGANGVSVYVGNSTGSAGPANADGSQSNSSFLVDSNYIGGFVFWVQNNGNPAAPNIQ